MSFASNKAVRSLLWFAALLGMLVHSAWATGEGANEAAAFQVYLWPGASHSMRPGEQPVTQTDSAGIQWMAEYVPPRIQFEPYQGSTAETVEAAERRISPLYTYRGANPLVFFEEMPNSEGDLTRKALAQVHLDRSKTRSLLVFFAAADATAAYRILPIPVGDELRPGNALVYNLTGERLACLVDTDRFVLDASGSALVALNGRKRLSIVIRIGSAGDDGVWRERHAQRLNIDPANPAVIAIYHPEGNSDSFRLMYIDLKKSAGVPPAR